MLQPARVSSFVLLLLLLMGSNSRAGQLRDSKSLAILENPSPRRYVKVVYSGPRDARRRADGFGTAAWYRADSVLALEYSGEFKNGYMHGKGLIIVHESCISFQGEFEEGDPASGSVAYECEGGETGSGGLEGREREPRMLSDTLQVGSAVDTTDEGFHVPCSSCPMPTLPQLKTMKTPPYPRAALRFSVEGVVRTVVLVDKTGHVKKVRIKQSSHSCFALRAVEAAYSAEFIPAKYNGKPVALWIEMTVRFSTVPW